MRSLPVVRAGLTPRSGDSYDTDLIVESIAARHPPNSAVDSFLLCIGDWQRKPLPIEALQAANVPLLIVQGDASDPFPLEAANEWLQTIPGAKLHLVEGAWFSSDATLKKPSRQERTGGSHGLALTHADACNAAATKHYLAHPLPPTEVSSPVSSDFKVRHRVPIRASLCLKQAHRPH